MAERTIKRRLYNIWYLMLRRTSDQLWSDYARYGGRGIKCCEEWKDFDRFYCDMVKSYKPGLTLERINNDAGYSKLNCKWATKKEQANNRRTSKYITINGETKTLAEWSDESPVKNSTIKQRIYGYGWPVDRALKA